MRIRWGGRRGEIGVSDGEHVPVGRPWVGGESDGNDQAHFPERALHRVRRYHAQLDEVLDHRAFSVIAVDRCETTYLHGEPTRLESSDLDRVIYPNLAGEGKPVGAIALR